jgi:hypothetical protein
MATVGAQSRLVAKGGYPPFKESSFWEESSLKGGAGGNFLEEGQPRRQRGQVAGGATPGKDGVKDFLPPCLWVPMPPPTPARTGRKTSSGGACRSVPAPGRRGPKKGRKRK